VRLPGLSHDTNLTHPDLVVTKHTAVPTIRTLYCVSNVGPELNLRINNADINTLKTALLTRMYFCEVKGEFVEPPNPSNKDVNDTLFEFRTALCDKLKRATPVSLNDTVEMYKGRKKAIYTQAMESLQQNCVSRKDAVSVAFVKCEKVNPTKAPRCIQPRDPRYNLALGRYIKPIEHKIYRAIQKVYGDGPTVIKGYNVQQVARIMCGKWNSFRQPIAIGLDATKFDMHVSAAMLRWEHSVYQHIYPNDHHLKELLSWQVHNIGRGFSDDGSLKYKVEGKRFSGDMNTALGNCIIMCGMVHAYAKSRGVSIKLMNNGDDCVVFMEAEDEERFQRDIDEWFLKLGFRMTVEPTCHNLAEIEFCQMHCIRTANGPVMVRNIPTALAKDAMSIVPLDSEKAMRKWMGAVGECGLALCRGVPIMQSYYSMYHKQGSTSKIRDSVQFQTGIHMLMHDLQGESTQITEEAREDVYIAWGLEPDMQVDLEKMFGERQISYGSHEYGDHSEYEHITL